MSSGFLSDSTGYAPGEAAESVEASASALSWAAILSGAAAAAALSLVLVALGSGLGLASVSPWPYAGASITTFAVSTGLWLIVVQWAASALGGYLAGRLRTKWAGVHTHEVFFRDTAHGFLTWAVATIVVALLFALGTSAVIGGGVRAASSVAGGGAQGAANNAQINPAAGRAYDVDSLFRSGQPNANASGANASPSNAPLGDARMEASRILASGIGNGDVPAADRAYLAQLVAARSGIPQADAEKRVDEVIAREKDVEAKVRQAADTARKATSAASIFLALSLIVGAFIASVAAAIGGSQRDKSHPATV